MDKQTDDEAAKAEATLAKGVRSSLALSGAAADSSRALDLPVGVRRPSSRVCAWASASRRAIDDLWRAIGNICDLRLTAERTIEFAAAG